MRRDDVFKNIAFGGAWSERIRQVERRQAALELLEEAILMTADKDLREDPAVCEALDLATVGLPKAELLRAAWRKALSLQVAGQRREELTRLHRLISTAVGEGGQV